jgi:ribonucleoside-triphosphate reductase
VNIVKRDGRIESFDAFKIHNAVRKCCERLGLYRHELPSNVANAVTAIVDGKFNGQVTVEQVQDLVEQQLMAQGEYEIAKGYILYREEHKRQRDGFPITAEETELVNRDNQYFPTELQKFQFKDKYSRWNDAAMRRETWEETVDRTINFFK